MSCCGSVVSDCTPQYNLALFSRGFRGCYFASDSTDKNPISWKNHSFLFFCWISSLTRREANKIRNRWKPYPEIQSWNQSSIQTEKPYPHPDHRQSTSKSTKTLRAEFSINYSILIVHGHLTVFFFHALFLQKDGISLCAGHFGQVLFPKWMQSPFWSECLTPVSYHLIQTLPRCADS